MKMEMEQMNIIWNTLKIKDMKMRLLQALVVVINNENVNFKY